MKRFFKKNKYFIDLVEESTYKNRKRAKQLLDWIYIYIYIYMPKWKT